MTSHLDHLEFESDEKTADKLNAVDLKRALVSDHILYQNDNRFTPDALVYKDLSPVCDNKGFGVFAARDIPKDTPLTFYAGHVYTESPKNKKKSDYVYEFADGKHKIDGMWIPPDGPWWTKQGVGHLLNDNIHVHATGKETNAYFAELEMIDKETGQRIKRVVILTLQDVCQGQELFVSYSLEYWLHRLHHKNANIDLGNASYWWVYTMSQLVQQLTDRMYAHGRLVDDDEYTREPFIGYVHCADMYENSDHCLTSEFYDFYYDTEVREGEFDLIFAFDDARDMVCCEWQDDKGDCPSHECRLTVYYMLDISTQCWKEAHVSCWHCGQTLDHLCFWT